VWPQWFFQKGVDVGDLPGVRFDQFAPMIQASVFGLGAAIVPKYLIEAELEEGRLVVLLGSETSVIGSYFLVWPDRSENYPPLGAFRTWITQTICQEQVT
jgi:DNA-binding transcriptional LysR family regulator